MRKRFYEEATSVKQRFATRKLKVGMVSVLIGFTVMFGGAAVVNDFVVPEEVFAESTEADSGDIEITEVIQRYITQELTDEEIIEVVKNNATIPEGAVIKDIKIDDHQGNPGTQKVGNFQTRVHVTYDDGEEHTQDYLVNIKVNICAPGWNADDIPDEYKPKSIIPPYRPVEIKYDLPVTKEYLINNMKNYIEIPSEIYKTCQVIFEVQNEDQIPGYVTEETQSITYKVIYNCGEVCTGSMCTGGCRYEFEITINYKRELSYSKRATLDSTPLELYVGDPISTDDIVNQITVGGGMEMFVQGRGVSGRDQNLVHTENEHTDQISCYVKFKDADPERTINVELIVKPAKEKYNPTSEGIEIEKDKPLEDEAIIKTIKDLPGDDVPDKQKVTKKEVISKPDTNSYGEKEPAVVEVTYRRWYNLN